MIHVDPLVSDHLAHLRYLGYSPATVYQRNRALVRLLAATPHTLAEMTEAGVRARLDVILGAEGRATELSHIRSFYVWAVEYDRLSVDPTRRLRRPKVPRRLPRPIGEQDLADALLDAPDRPRPWFLLAAWAGLRACEVAQLRAEDLLFSDDDPAVFVRGKGSKERFVPVSEWMVDELAGCHLRSSGWLFRYQDGTPGPIPPHLVSHISADYLRSVGIDATIHQLRHRFGTQVQREWKDIRVTQDLLGHASLNSTQIYTKVSREDMRSAVEMLPTPKERREAV